MSKVNAYVEISGYFLMVSELATVVQGQCVNTRLMGRETVSYTVMNRISRFVWGMREKGISALSFDQRDDRTLVALADEGIAFPIAHTAPAIDNGRAILDRDLVGDAAATAVATIALALYLATTQISV